MPAPTQHRSPQQDSASELAEQVTVHVYVRREDDHWSAVIPEYTIAGRGDTAQAAADNAASLLCDYLSVCYRDGLTLAESRRPAPRALQARMAVELVWARLRHRAQMQTRSVHPLNPAAC